MTMTDRLTGLIDFARKAEIHWEERPNDGFVFRTGDPDDDCTREDGAFIVRKSERGIVSNPLIVAEDLDDIEKYLSFRYGATVRKKVTDFPELELNKPQIVLGSQVNGFQIDGTLGDVRISWSEGSRLRSVSGLGRFDAARFVVYGRFSAEQIRQSFLHREGFHCSTTLSKSGSSCRVNRHIRTLANAVGVPATSVNLSSAWTASSQTPSSSMGQ